MNSISRTRTGRGSSIRTVGGIGGTGAGITDAWFSSSTGPISGLSEHWQDEKPIARRIARKANSRFIREQVVRATIENVRGMAGLSRLRGRTRLHRSPGSERWRPVSRNFGGRIKRGIRIGGADPDRNLPTGLRAGVVTVSQHFPVPRPKPASEPVRERRIDGPVLDLYVKDTLAYVRHLSPVFLAGAKERAERLHGAADPPAFTR